MRIIRNYILEFDDIDEAFRFQEYTDKHINYWCSSHQEYGYNTTILVSANTFIVQIKLYAK